MVKYKVNLKFKEDGNNLNEIIISVLKIELEKDIFMTCNILNRNVSLETTHYSQSEGSMNLES